MSSLAYEEEIGAGLAHVVGHRPGLHQVAPLPTEGTVVGGADRFARVDVESDHRVIDLDRLARQRGLTPRDVVVLGFLALGWTTSDIAHELAYAESTIKKEVHFIVRRLGARNRTHAVAMAIRGAVI